VIFEVLGQEVKATGSHLSIGVQDRKQRGTGLFDAAIGCPGERAVDLELEHVDIGECVGETGGAAVSGARIDEYRLLDPWATLVPN